MTDCQFTLMKERDWRKEMEKEGVKRKIQTEKKKKGGGDFWQPTVCFQPLLPETLSGLLSSGTIVLPFPPS